MRQSQPKTDKQRQTESTDRPRTA